MPTRKRISAAWPRLHLSMRRARHGLPAVRHTHAYAVHATMSRTLVIWRALPKLSRLPKDCQDARDARTRGEQCSAMRVPWRGIGSHVSWETSVGFAAHLRVRSASPSSSVLCRLLGFGCVCVCGVGCGRRGVGGCSAALIQEGCLLWRNFSGILSGMSACWFIQMGRS